MSGNTQTRADAMWHMRDDGNGMRHIFDLCGDTSLPFYDAFQRSDHTITHFLTRDQRHAKIAAAHGLKNVTVAEPRALQDTLKSALQHHKGPTLREIISQPLQDADAPKSGWIA